MRYILENEDLKVEIESVGAEVISIQDKKGRDYLWNGDGKFWGRRSPILFPFIGRLKNGAYRYKGKEYKVGPHGFARDMEFSLFEQTESVLWFEIKDTEATYLIYPFHFSLKIGYHLVGKKLEVSWEVENLESEENMYFSIGAHPGFLCPIFGEGEDKEDYVLELTGRGDELSYQFADLETGLLIKEKKEMKLEAGRISLTKDFFDESTYLFLNHQLKEVSLITPSGKKYVTVSFDMPILALWSPEKMNAPFICIEPWYGCCDGEWFEGTLEEREWGNKLAPGAIFTNSYSITIY